MTVLQEEIESTRVQINSGVGIIRRSKAESDVLTPCLKINSRRTEVTGVFRGYVHVESVERIMRAKNWMSSRW